MTPKEIRHKLAEILRHVRHKRISPKDMQATFYLCNYASMFKIITWDDCKLIINSSFEAVDETT